MEDLMINELLSKSGFFNRRDLLACLAGCTAGSSALGLSAMAAPDDASTGEASERSILAAAEDLKESGIELKKLTQVAFVVKDIDAASKRFADLLGMDVPKPIITDTEDKAHTKYRGKPTPARAKLAFFPLGQVTFELIEPIGGPSTWQEALDEQGESVHHIAFEVNDMDKVLEWLDKKGYPTIQTGDFTGGRYAYVDTTAAFTTIIELLEIH